MPDGVAAHLLDGMTKSVSQIQCCPPPLLKRVVGDYRPRTIINMPSGENDVEALADRLCKVSARMLSIEVDYLGQLAYDATIHKSTQSLVPHVTRHPEGPLDQFCRLVMGAIEPRSAAAGSPVALTA